MEVAAMRVRKEESWATLGPGNTKPVLSWNRNDLTILYLKPGHGEGQQEAEPGGGGERGENGSLICRQTFNNLITSRGINLNIYIF